VHAGFDSGAYRDMVALARHTTWLNGIANRWSDYGLLLFVALAAVGLRRNGSGWRALWVPCAMVAAFVFSALTKLGFAEQRPCRTLPAVGHIVAVCPPLGDYAFPSNHAVLAGAGAMAVWMLDRRLGAVAAVNAVVIAAARVSARSRLDHAPAAVTMASVRNPAARPRKIPQVVISLCPSRRPTASSSMTT
jgi:hypothetical protein